MNTRFYFLFSILLLSPTPLLFSQSVSTHMGARANGIGYSASTLFDEWGVFNNIAGTAKLESTSAAEIEKDLTYEPTWKMGIEYKFHKKFCARTGYNIHPNTAFFGLGFKTKKFTLDYAVQHNTLLSLSHQATVGYQFTQK